MPYGDRTHAGGIFEHYKEFFTLEEDLPTLKLIKLLATGNTEALINKCPCNSGMILNHCHGHLIMHARTCQNQIAFLNDFIECVNFIKNKKGIEVPRSLMTDDIKRLIQVCLLNQKQSVKN